MRGEQRGGEGCSWEQDTCTSSQGQHTDTRRGQGCGVPSSAQDACTSSQDHHNVQGRSVCCVSARLQNMQLQPHEPRTVAFTERRGRGLPALGENALRRVLGAAMPEPSAPSPCRDWRCS